MDAVLEFQPRKCSYPAQYNLESLMLCYGNLLLIRGPSHSGLANISNSHS